MLSEELSNLPVYTQSGEHLGKVASFDFDVDMHIIEHYYIKTGLIKGLGNEQLVVHQSQVISVSKEKMVVEDNIVKERSMAKGFGLVSPATE